MALRGRPSRNERLLLAARCNYYQNGTEGDQDGLLIFLAVGDGLEPRNTDDDVAGWFQTRRSGNAWVVQTKEQVLVRFRDADWLVPYASVLPYRKFHPCINTVEEMTFMVRLCRNYCQIALARLQDDPRLERPGFFHFDKRYHFAAETLQIRAKTDFSKF